LATRFFGASQAMQAVMVQVNRAAAGRNHIIIIGEPGTGRELVAREIHRRGASAGGGFVKVASASHSPETLELDLFGHRSRGGRSQQQEPRILERIARGGQLHQALGGTIFFERLTQVPSRVQARLARLFRDGELVVMHQRNPVDFNVRAIAAVEHSYDEAVQEGRIREDLHRLMSAVRINLPPLRHRREDIPSLASLFVEDFCRQSKVRPKTLSEPAQQLLAALPWRGNALELRSLLQDLVLRVRGDVIRQRDILTAVQLDGRTKSFILGGTLREARARFERDYIAAVLECHHGRIPEAARTLGIQRCNLYRKMRRLKLSAFGRRRKAPAVDPRLRCATDTPFGAPR